MPPLFPSRFTTAGNGEVWDAWRGRRLTRCQLPCTDERLTQVQRLASVRSSEIQNLIGYRCDQFEIEVWLDPLIPAPAETRDRSEGVPADEIQRLASLTGTPGIDFRQKRLGPAGRRVFPLTWSPRPTLGAMGGETLPGSSVPLPSCEPHWFVREDLVTDFLAGYQHPGTPLTKRVTIRVEMDSPSQRRFAEDCLCQQLAGEGVWIIHAPSHGEGVHSFFRRNLGLNGPATMAETAAAFRQVALQRGVTQVVLLAGEVARGEDGEWLRTLCDHAGLTGLMVVVFGGEPEGFPFDLELHQKGGNLLEPASAGPPPPETGEGLQSAVPAPADWPVDRDGWLAGFNAGHPELRDQGGLLDFLEHGWSWTRGTDRSRRAAADLLFRAGRFRGLRRRLEEGDAPAASPWQTVRRAHLFRLEKRYTEMARCLDRVGRPPADIADEYHYLRFIQFQKAAVDRQAELFRAKLKSPLYRHLATIQHSDVWVYGGELARAERELRATSQALREAGWRVWEMESRKQLALVWRMAGQLTEAENEYRELIVRSENDALPWLTADLAVDLGNLLMAAGDWPAAEGWYRRALSLTTEERVEGGAILAKSNLIDVAIIRGHWREAERLIREVSEYDHERGQLRGLAIDRYNRAFLCYLRHDLTKARRWLDEATGHFITVKNERGRIDAELLRAMIALSSGQRGDSQGEIAVPDRAADDQRIAWEVLSSWRTRGKSPPQWDRLADITSPELRYTLLVLGIRALGDPSGLSDLKDLSVRLSRGQRGYHFYEYHSLRLESLPAGTPLPHEEVKLAEDTADFFTAAGRKPPMGLLRLLTQLQEERERQDVYDCARWCGDAARWTGPDDFFRSLWPEITRRVRVDLGRMVVFDEGKPTIACGTHDEFAPLLDDLLTKSGNESGRWTAAELGRRLHRRERVFYPFASTQIRAWNPGPGLRFALILAATEDPPPGTSWFDRLEDLLVSFSALFLPFYENRIRAHDRLNRLVGDSPPMRELKERIVGVARVDFSVLITGESGSGKELVARAIHDLSRRSGGPFVPVNAAAIPDNLLEAELFGYRRGAFSGATEGKTGLIESAHGGTLFLDEIADLPLPLQAKLLRTLQEREIRRLGENRTVPVDVRILSATHRDLAAMAREGQFRQDLLFRLQDLVVAVPPLRERLDDLPLLVPALLTNLRAPPVTDEEVETICQQLSGQNWPGNVRQLESWLKNWITFPPREARVTRLDRPEKSLVQARARFEREYLRRTLAANDGRRQVTADSLGISRVALFRLLRKHGLAGPVSTKP